MTLAVWLNNKYGFNDFDIVKSDYLYDDYKFVPMDNKVVSALLESLFEEK